MGMGTSSASVTVNDQGVAFLYPNGWHFKQETRDHQSWISIESPEGALVSLTIYDQSMEPRQLSEMILDNLKGQFPGAAARPATGKVGGFDAEGYAMSFIHRGVPFTAHILSFRGGRLSFTLVTQAADAQMSSVQPGFDLIKNTLVVK